MNCEKCGAIIPDGDVTCLNCGYTAGQKEIRSKESVLAGTVGAFIGALIGGGCIILLSQLGYIASVSGVVLEINEELEDSPENLNEDPYGAWIIKVENVTEEEELLTAEEYEAHCAEEG